MKEIIDLRKPREKHFLNEDGTYTLYAYEEDVHFLKNGQYQEFDTTIVENENVFITKESPILYTFSKKSTDAFLLKLEKDRYFLHLNIENKKINPILNKNTILYKNILENIDIQYDCLPNKIKDTIILHHPTNDFKNLLYKIQTNLKLKLNENGKIIATNNEEQIFTIDPPTLTDRNQKEYPICYQLENDENHYYLHFQIDENILEDENNYPLTIDPTIDTSKEESVFDTYIYPGDENINRNVQDVLKVGVDENNTIYRTLMKFTLPNIGTASDVIDARVCIVPHPDKYYYSYQNFKKDIINVHAINIPWKEEDATWNGMHDKYNDKVEDYFYGEYAIQVPEFNENGGLIGYKCELNSSYFNITNLVKRWYTGLENNGILLKANNEIHKEESQEYYFFSKNNNAIEKYDIENPKPFLIINYRNQNGLEDYMTYQNIGFSQGGSYINNLTGNVTSIFEINSTLSGKFPITLSLIYNTNDVILNNTYGCAKGYKFNYYQTLKEVEFDSVCLEYLDEDGTIHYFRKITDNDNNEKIIDEDGLNLIASKENDIYTLTDKNQSQLKFTKREDIYYLTEIKNSTQNSIKIEYNNQNKINKIIDGNNEEICIVYTEDQIIATSNYDTTTLNLINNQISSINNKYGTITIHYNSKQLVNEIIDTNGLAKLYDYYENTLYRLKKISEIGENGTVGNTLEFIYEFNVTRVRDSKGRLNSYTFNNQGNTICITNLDEDGDFKNSYGILKEYFSDFNGTKPEIKNKLQLETTSIKHTKNYMYDSSFENGSIDISSLSNEFAHTGQYSLKVDRLYNWDISNITNNGAYTFSAYFKTNTRATLSLEYSDNPTTEVKVFRKVEIEPNDDFVRYSIPIYISETYKKDFFTIQLISDSLDGIIYVDDVQLEEGETANYYNLIENSDFSNGLKSWTYNAVDKEGNTINDGSHIKILPNGESAFCMHCAPETSKSLDQFIPISGKANDTYRLSFWYKNEGIRDTGMETANMALLGFSYPDSEEGECIIPCILNLHGLEWQYFQTVFVAEQDYQNAYLSFISQDNANDLYITNISLTKDLENTSYEYDAKGNLISVKDKNKGINEFKYDKNNQLIASFSPKGNSFVFEYDNKNTEKLLQGISKKGISNKIEYDEFDNPIKTIIKNNATQKIEDHSFYIRLKSTNKYLQPNYKNFSIDLKEITCSNECWDFTKEDDYYVIKSSVIPLYLTNIATLNKEEKTYFEIIKNDNGSISLKTDNKCLTVEDKSFVYKEYDKENLQQQFYLEPFESKKYIETSATYTTDGKFIKTTTDALGRVTNYDIDATTGLIKSITDPNETITSYEYNEKKQITKVKKNNQETSYSYNDHDLLSKITCENKEYNFTYDEFLNTKEVKVNNQLLVTHEYEENNGNLISSNYGNNTSVSYTYDELDRVKNVTKNNKVYTHIYNNQNELAKITAENEIYNYYYDLAERLSKYEIAKKGQDENDFRIETIEKLFTIDYDYDVNNNITEKIYDHKNNRQTITYTYDEDDSIIKVKLDDNIEENFNYDELGRLKNQNINNQIPVEYEYYQNGNKTSLVLKSMKIENDLYEYIYDTLYNITHIYKNKELQNYYVYDDLNELLEDHNYSQNTKTKYRYDTSGNIVGKQEYDLNTNTLLHADTYEYTNLSWKDQLTKFNDTNITYDKIGNPTTIGDATLTWWGRELQSYQNNMFQINYSYNKEGIRNKKIVNGVETNYYVENSNIIFEETNGNALYYMRTDKNNLIGLKYNDETYYYKKNYQGDIIGIYNSNYEEIATYEYDSFGNIVSIKDANGVYITDSNHIAIINPYRYRSYYYDIETGLYYLNSRYYNPLWGRFINADNYLCFAKNNIALNLYAYCENNPIINIDSEGNFSFKNLWQKVSNGFKNTVNYIFQTPQRLKNTATNILKAGQNLYNSAKEHFVFEVGYGVGAGVKVQSVGGVISSTANISYKNGQKSQSTSAKIEASGFGYKYGIEGKHIDDGLHDNFFVFFDKKQRMCENTSISYNVGREKNNISYETSNYNSKFIGINLEGYLGAGGYIKIGFEY